MLKHEFFSILLFDNCKSNVRSRTWISGAKTGKIISGHIIQRTLQALVADLLEGAVLMCALDVCGGAKMSSEAAGWSGRGGVNGGIVPCPPTVLQIGPARGWPDQRAMRTGSS